jgi:hypothetical protein
VGEDEQRPVPRGGHLDAVGRAVNLALKVERPDLIGRAGREREGEQERQEESEGRGSSLHFRYSS